MTRNEFSSPKAKAKMAMILRHVQIPFIRPLSPLFEQQQGISMAGHNSNFIKRRSDQTCDFSSPSGDVTSRPSSLEKTDSDSQADQNPSVHRLLHFLKLSPLVGTRRRQHSR
jgi:hypothetical protein